MRNPLEYYKKDIEKIEDSILKTTIHDNSTPELSEDEIKEQNEYIIDFIVNQ